MLRLVNVSKQYDNGIKAVSNFNLEVSSHEFIVLVGPSGCGKTTTLRMIAGLEQVSSGEIYIQNQYSNDVLAKDRHISMVFQSFALFPHLNVYDNLAFGLQMKKVDKKTIDKQVQKAAQHLQLQQCLQQSSKSLSGGQRQRVALGRMLVDNEPVCLMDEPLSHLDISLKAHMREYLLKVHKELKATTIMVSHDQKEAMYLADKIVVMNAGEIQQVGTPQQLYEQPNSLFVANFIGDETMNILMGTIEDNCFIGKGICIPLNNEQLQKLQKYDNQKIIVGIRAQHIYETKEAANFIGTIQEVTLVGREVQVQLQLAHQKIIMYASPKQNMLAQDQRQFACDIQELHFFDEKSGKRI